MDIIPLAMIAKELKDKKCSKNKYETGSLILFLKRNFIISN